MLALGTLFSDELNFSMGHCWELLHHDQIMERVGEQLGRVGKQLGRVGEQLGRVGEQLGRVGENWGELANNWGELGKLGKQ